MCNLLCETIYEVLKKIPKFDITQPEKFELLLREVETNFGEHTANYSKDKLVLKIAVCILGKGNRGEPPLGVMDDLYQLLINSIPDQDERIRRCVEFVIAYGCGWQRSINNNRGWEDIWSVAVSVMGDLVSNYIRQALKALTHKGACGVRRFESPNNQDIEADARYIALQFIHNNFDPNTQPKYQRYHALSEWNPEEGNLYNFLQWCVQGSPGSGQDFCRITRAGFFSQGMYYQELKNLGQLDKGDMEFKKCKEIINGEQCQTIFEGYKCPRQECKKAFNDKHSPRIKKTMLYVPNIYNYIDRKRCNKCNNFFPKNSKVCPLCGSHNIAQRTTSLLNYTGGIPQEDNNL
jgi:hypothetical protein